MLASNVESRLLKVARLVSQLTLTRGSKVNGLSKVYPLSDSYLSTSIILLSFL